MFLLKIFSLECSKLDGNVEICVFFAHINVSKNFTYLLSLKGYNIKFFSTFLKQKYN